MNKNVIWKGVFWVIDGKVVSKKVRCDEFGDMIIDEDREYPAEIWSNNHKKIWFTLPRTVTQGKAYNYFPRGRVEIRNKKAIIFLNPCLCYEEMIRKIKMEFRLEKNKDLRDILVKADGSKHYRCYSPASNAPSDCLQAFGDCGGSFDFEEELNE